MSLTSARLFNHCVGFSVLQENSSVLTFSFFCLPVDASQSYIPPKCPSTNFGSAEKQKRKIAEERRLEREKRAEEAAHIWEQQILPDWKIVHRSPELRKLWWQGIPTSMRGKMWENAVGNPLSLSKGDALIEIFAAPD